VQIKGQHSTISHSESNKHSTRDWFEKERKERFGSAEALKGVCYLNSILLEAINIKV
jgi:hypothetical protein